MDIWHYVYTAFINLVLVYLLVDTWRSHRSTLDKLKDFKPEQPPNVVKMARAHSTEVTRREPVPVSKRWTRITVSMLLVTMIGGLSYMYYTFTEFIDMDGVVLTGVLIAGVDLVLIVLLTSMWRR